MMYHLGASMQMWLHQNQKLFGLKCFFKCVKQFGCGNLDFFFFNSLFIFSLWSWTFTQLGHCLEQKMELEIEHLIWTYNS